MSRVLKKQNALEDFRDFKDRVKAAYPIERAFTDAGIQLQNSGGSLKACCPFHQEKTPSLLVSKEYQYYQCFGAGCGARGDSFTFLQDLYNISFSESVKMAAERARILVPAQFAKSSSQNGIYQKSPLKTSYQKNGIQDVPKDLQPYPFLEIEDKIKKPEKGKQFWLMSLKSNAPFPVNPVMVHDYRDIDGNYLMSILRFMRHNAEKGVEEKSFCPARYDRFDGLRNVKTQPVTLPSGEAACWVCQGVPTGYGRPLYGLENAAEVFQSDAPSILFVEGEKTCDAARRLTESGNTLCLTLMGGGQSAHKAWWKPLTDLIAQNPGKPLDIYIWPDSDNKFTNKDGIEVDRNKVFTTKVMKAMTYWMEQSGCDFDTINFRYAPPPEGTKDGWDLADAEDEKWSQDDVLNYLKNKSIVEDITSYLSDPEFEDQEIPLPFTDEQNALRIMEIENMEEVNRLIEQLEDEKSSLDVSEIGAEIKLFPKNKIVSEILVKSSDGDDQDPPYRAHLDILENPFFRVLGHADGHIYIFSKRACTILHNQVDSVKTGFLIACAPKEFWEGIYPRIVKNTVVGVVWDQAVSDIVNVAFDKGFWKKKNEVRLGSRIDRGRPIFHLGNVLFLPGIGLKKIEEVDTEYVYTLSTSAISHDFDNPFEENSVEIREYLDITKNLSWEKQTRELSILSTVGWVGSAPLCGISIFRSHLWVDGPSFSGKTWVISNLIYPIINAFSINAFGSTEPGIRRSLNSRFVPLIYDEAEAETRGNALRIKQIIGLSRTSSTNKGDMIQAEGDGVTQFEIASSFCLSSITSQLDQVADKTRFSRATLGKPLRGQEFDDRVKSRVDALITEDFCNRMLARIFTQSENFLRANKIFNSMLTDYLNIEQRFSDVYGNLCAGLWILLRDDLPASPIEAVNFLRDEIGPDIIEQMQFRNDDVIQERDHDTLFNHIMSHEIRVSSPNSGQSYYRIGNLIAFILGYSEDEEERDMIISQKEALRVLQDYGIRIGNSKKPMSPNEGEPTHLLIHKESLMLKQILEKTPYAKGYADVIKQSGNVTFAENCYFGGSLGYHRPLAVPLTNLKILFPEEGPSV
jgi:hypothetical protein